MVSCLSPITTTLKAAFLLMAAWCVSWMQWTVLRVLCVTIIDPPVRHLTCRDRTGLIVLPKELLRKSRAWCGTPCKHSRHICACADIATAFTMCASDGTHAADTSALVSQSCHVRVADRDTARRPPSPFISCCSASLNGSDHSPRQMRQEMCREYQGRHCAAQHRSMRRCTAIAGTPGAQQHVQVIHRAWAEHRAAAMLNWSACIHQNFAGCQKDWKKR